MPDYNYRGVNRLGKPIKGTVAAYSLLALEDKLAESGSVLIEVLDDEKEGLGNANITIFKPRVKSVELVDFFTTLRVMTRAGITLLDGLKAVKVDIENPLLHKTLGIMIRAVESGSLFSDALSHHPKIFSTHIIKMTAAGESSGKLPETFDELVRYMEWQESLKKDIKQATVYPVTIVTVLTIFVLILFTFVVPRFVKLLTGLNVPMPLPTKIVMAISNFLTTKWWIWVPAILFMVIAFLFVQRHEGRFALTIDKMKLNIIVFGELLRMLCISRFAFNFAALHKAGISIIQNVELCEPLMGNKVMEEALKGAKQEIMGGKMLNESLRHYDIFPPKVIMMIAVGENSGELGKALEHVANYYNEEVPKKIKKIFSIMEPVVMLTIIGVVGFTAAAIILPILSMFTAAGISR